MSDIPSNVAAEQGIVLDDSGEPKRRLHPVRRLLQFSLRGLMVLVAVCSVWLGIAFHRAREQAEIVRFLESRHPGFVFYDFHEAEPDILDPEATSPYPAWLVDAFGVDFFHNVTRVFPDRTTDAELAQICKLSKLRGMILGISTISSEGLAPLTQLHDLELLAIQSSEIDNRGLVELAKLDSLRKLTLVDARINNHGLRHLNNATQLIELFLSDTQVTPDGVKELSRSLPNCTIYLEDDEGNVVFSAGPEASARD